MKFDMNAAWQDAIRMITSSRDVVVVVAGLFFFLPSVAVTLLAPGLQQMPQGVEGEEALAVLQAAVIDAWPILLVSTIATTVGMLTLLALLRDSTRPTVGEAIGIGAKSLIPYIAAQLLVGLALGLVIVLGVSIGTATGLSALAFVLVIVGIVLAIYVYVKVSLTAPVIAIEKQFNPIQAVQRSWKLTKGNSLRLFGFYLLLGLAVLVFSILVGLLTAGITAALGTDTAGQLAAGIVNGLFTAGYTTLFYAITAAIHRQLSGPSTERTAETFE